MTFLLKLVMAPVIIIVTTYIARRWGENIGGLIIGLPLTSAPVSIFFTLEQGRPFAANAARGALLGLIPVAVFCAVYAKSAKRLPWYLASAAGISLYLVTVWGMSYANPGLGITGLLVPAVLLTALLLIAREKVPVRKLPSPWWDLPLRMIIATILIVGITALAGSLGPTWSGLLSPFPVFTFVMATFSHHQGGPSASVQLIRGVLTGLFSYTAFFLVVGGLINQVSPAITYSLAALAALGLNGANLVVLLWRQRSAQRMDSLCI